MIQDLSKFSRYYLNTPREELTVWTAFLRLLRHPYHLLLRRWNWKAAILSCLLRGSLFFTINATAGLQAATAAMLREVSFLIITAGFYGAIVQAFRRATPSWAATLIMMCLLPALNHMLEFVVHSAGGTRKITASISVSIGVSALSACFNLFAMRRGVLIVGRHRQSLVADLLQIPDIALAFLLVLPKKIFTLKAAPTRVTAEPSHNLIEEREPQL